LETALAFFQGINMNLAGLGSTVAKYAPLLGGALSSPGGVVIGSILASVFGSDSNKPEKLQNIIITDPDAAIKLRQIESEHQLELRKMVLHAAHEKMVASQEKTHDCDCWVMFSITYILTISIIFVLASMCFYFVLQ
jgi:hypothetical protein